MNKILLRGILFCLCAGAVLLFLFRDHSPFGRNNSSFAVKTGRAFNRIEFAEGENRLVLIREDSRWLANGGEEARKNEVDFLLNVLTGMRIKSPVSEDLFEKEISEKELKPVKVRVFNKRRLLNSFLVYRTESVKYGNIMKKSIWSKPFITYLPDYEGEIGSCFTTDGLFWKPYVLFRYLPSEISEVRFKNFSDPPSSFSIVKKDSGYIFTDLAKEPEGWEPEKVIRYLTYFFNIPFESWESGMQPEEIENIVREDPLFRIMVRDIRGDSLSVYLWRKWNFAEGKRYPDDDRLWGRSDKTDRIFIIRYFDIDPILKKRSYFLK